MAYLNTLPEQANLLDVFAAYPQLAQPALALAQHVLRGSSELSIEQREFLFAFVSGLNACHFCYGSHMAAARALGADEKAIGAAVEDIEQAPVDNDFKSLLRYTKKLTETPARITQADVDAVRVAGWSDNALHDAIAVCALGNFFNHWVDGTGADANEIFLANAGVILAEQGYESLIASEEVGETDAT